MKKIKKESLKLEKEVITRLTQDHLSQVVGGGTFLNTLHSQCLCISDGPNCHTKDPNCTAIKYQTKENGGNECLSKYTACLPFEPETKVCLVTANQPCSNFEKTV